METLRNNLTNMHLGGEAGKILTANETNWLHALLTDDPGLFDGFTDRGDGAIFKTMWHGEFPGKLLSGIAQTYLLNNDPETKRIGDVIAYKLSEVQEPDGYLGPWKKSERYEADVAQGGLGKWDTWGQYHCIYGLLRWYQVAGNRNAFDTARRALDNIYDHFIAGGIPIAAQNWAECNLAVGHAFALFYEETGEKRYLNAAIRIVDNDWNDGYTDFYTQKTLCCGWLNAALGGRAYFESGQPRWEGLYALETLAPLWRSTGEDRYRRALDALWHGMRDNDRHNTGSFGTGEGATGDPYGPGSETCNTVAWMAFSTEYLKITRDPLAADELELSFFNAALGSLLSGERNFTYMNDSDGKREPARTVLESHSYAGARDMSCCQANGNRGISQIAEWAVLSGRDELYFNYYGTCSLETSLENGYRLTAAQKTDYPKNGVIEIEISTDCPDELTLYFRIPAWSLNTALTVNGEAVNAAAGSYCAVRRVWGQGDKVRLILDMSPRFLVNDSVKPVRLSVYHGPLLLAFRTGSGLTRNTLFSVGSLREMVCGDGEGLVNFSVNTASGQSAVLTDYYTAGKNGDNYVSWLASDQEF